MMIGMTKINKKSEDMREVNILVKTYTKTDVEIVTKKVEIFECPDCGFEFNAMHEDEKGGWTCSLCEIEDYKSEVNRLTLLADGLASHLQAERSRQS